jgi:magnesium chelatase family protein
LIQEKHFKLDLSDYIIMGELALDGSIMAVSSVLPASIYADKLNKGIICPWENRLEAKISKNKKILAIKHLNEIIKYLNGDSVPEKITDSFHVEKENLLDMKDVKGQDSAKRAMEIAAAGGHNIILQGPPGTGKSMLAKRMPSIMPELKRQEILEINLITSITGKFKDTIYTTRPFREPHHSCSTASIVGGGKFAEPGEITLAHNGILFLDELPEFSRQVLEALRQPIESREITISRVNAKVTYPANFQFVAAMNPCRCGYLGSNSGKECKYNQKCGAEYKNKISGPILDRIDIFVQVSNIDIFSLYEKQEESSSEIKIRVIKARDIQLDRYKDEKFSLNAHMSNSAMEKFVNLDEETIDFLKKALKSSYISMRGYNRILKVARTIADLENSEAIKKKHVTESLYYKM